jgi:predicted DNA-binding protein
MVIMQNKQLHFKKLYSKQLRDGILTVRMDQEEMSRLFRLSNISRRNKSDIVRDALFEYLRKFDGII